MKKGCCVSVMFAMLWVASLAVATEPYKLGVLPIVGESFYRVAEVKGFWEKQGVRVEVVGYATPIDTNRGGIQRLVDIKPVPMATIATYRDNGVFDAIYLGTLNVQDHHKYLIITNDLLNKSLKGQTIGIFLEDPANVFLLESYLSTVDTSLKDVRLVPMNPVELEANFIHGRLQAVLTLDQGNKFYEPAGGVIVASTRDFYEPHGLISIREDPLNSIPRDDFKKILRGCVEAIVWQKDPANWDEYAAILREHILAGSADMSDEQIREVLNDSKALDLQELLEHNQQQLREHFMDVRDFLDAEDLVKDETLKEFTYESVIQNQMLIEVLQEFVP